MFDLITNSMVFLLQSLEALVGNYGWAIIVLTILVRVVLWPMSRSQAKSMKVMQQLQPKLKVLQDRHKNDPQKMQAEMMKIYKEHSFNPLGGCLPMLLQIPLFIGLYWAISSPNFITTGDPIFVDFIHLKRSGIFSHGGLSNDGKMSLSDNPSGSFMGIGKDHIVPEANMVVILKNGNKLDSKIPDTNKALDVLPKDLRGGIPITLSTNYERLGLKGYEGLIKTIELRLINNSTKEEEKLSIAPPADKNAPIESKLESVVSPNIPHIDVMILVALFAALMIVSQKQMTPPAGAQQNDQQAMMMKTMPIMFAVMLFFIPIPAGVLLYMVTNSLFQVGQTWWFNKEFDQENGTTPPGQNIVDIKPDATA